MPNSIFDARPLRDEKAAYAYVEAKIWPNGRVCPHCGVVDRSGALKGKSTRIGVYKCYACRKPFTVKVSTIFEDSHVPMHLWLQAIVMMCSSKKGISSNQLHRTLGVTLRTAWHMSHRIRLAMEDNGSGPLGGADLFLEADETFVGGKESNKHKSKRVVKGGTAGKAAVFSLVEREGQVRSFNVPDVTAKTLKEVIAKHADRESHLRTDEARRYEEIGTEFASHETVAHSMGEYVRGDAYTNTVENYFSILKRGIYGCYFHVSEAHLHRYLAEFDFRHNHRAKLGINDSERTAEAVRGAVGKRLTYRTPHSESAPEQKT
jgi:transposase-like protein